MNLAVMLVTKRNGLILKDMLTLDFFLSGQLVRAYYDPRG